MHRAEKSSSKLCRSREVERAQELHRRKISGVRSYLSGIISKPAAARPPNAFRRTQASVCGTVGSSTCTNSVATIVGVHGDGDGAEDNATETATESHPANGSAQSFDSYQDDEFESGSTHHVNDHPSKWFVGSHGADEGDTTSKEDEFRSPVAIRSVPPSHALLPPGPPPKKKSLNRAFRERKLREIEASNVGMLDRIRKSAAHYRNDDLRREWRQNVSYLSSICEFPLAKDAVASPSGHAMAPSPSVFGVGGHDDDDDLSFLEGKHASISAATVKASATRGGGSGPYLPSILPTSSQVHPIKAIPTSPKKAPLNLAPAFRSLRKAMPQQPALPPITSPSRGGACGGNPSRDLSTSALASASMLESAALSPRKSSAGVVLSSSRSEHSKPEAASSGSLEPHWRPSAPTRQASASETGASTFIGDLQALEGQPEAPDELKYQLLKTGRFVGGTYLVLTVFCGDGVRNAYGFDVFAFHRELQCEYSLSVSREMAHELIESVSSSSLAAETEAAAGTNWSMQQIARSICDHVQFAALEAGRGEVLFLLSSITEFKASDGGDQGIDGHGKPTSSGGSLLVDASPRLIALCVHQVVQVESGSSDSSHDNEEEDEAGRESNPHRPTGKRSSSGLKQQQDQQQQRRPPSKKRKLHVFASTCASTASDSSSGLSLRRGVSVDDASHTAIRFQVLDDAAATCPGASSCREDSLAETHLATEVSIDELFLVLDGERDPRHRRVSLERMAAAAVAHLHIISVPTGGRDPSASERVRDALILNARANPQLRVCENSPVPATSTSLQRKRSRQQLQTAACPLFSEPSRPTVLLQTGLVWRDAYLIAQVSVATSDEQSRMLYQPWRWRGHLVRDMDESIAVRVFNPASGLFSERVLSPANVCAMLEVLALAEGVAADLDTLAFAKQLLGRLRLDADLFGAQVIAFAGLERSLSSSTSAAGSRSPSSSPRAVAGSSPAQSVSFASNGRMRPVRVIEEERYPSASAAATVLQAHFRGFLSRKNGPKVHDGGRIDAVEEDEGEDEDEEEEHCAESSDPTDNESETGHDDGDNQSEAAPPSVRKGVKAGGRFVLQLQRPTAGRERSMGARTTTTVARIAALGELEVDVALDKALGPLA